MIVVKAEMIVAQTRIIVVKTTAIRAKPSMCLAKSSICLAEPVRIVAGAGHRVARPAGAAGKTRTIVAWRAG